MSNKQMLALIDQAPALLEALEEILELEESHHSLTEAGCIARDAIERVRSES